LLKMSQQGASGSSGGVADSVQGGAGAAPVQAQPQIWLPPAADCAGDSDTVGDTIEEHFWVPNRLVDKTYSLVEAVNDFHFAMMNDHDRNAFYRDALKAAVKPTDTVLEIGTGSGLLAMLSAKAGAEHVYAIEANKHLTSLAEHIIGCNGLTDQITVVNKLSTQVDVEVDIPKRANVLVSEILGTLLLGESALSFIADVRDRLLEPDATIIPAAGCQFISCIESPDIKSITSVSGWDGIKLDGFEALKDTVTVVFTKQYGFRLSSIPFKTIVPRISVADIDFYTDGPDSLPDERTISVKAQASGTIHAVMLDWEVYADRERTHVMSTNPEATRNNFPRDMQWGQALQLVEDASQDEARPVPLVVVEGDELEIVVRFSQDRAVMQFEVSKVGDSAGAAEGEKL